MIINLRNLILKCLGLEKSKSALESWLQQTDLTSPWSTKKEKSLNKSRPGNKVNNDAHAKFDHYLTLNLVIPNG